MPDGISINGDNLTLEVNGGFRSPSELTESESLQYFRKIVSYLSGTDSFPLEEKEVMIVAAKVLFEKASKDYEVKDELKDIVGHIGGILRDKDGIKESGNAFENFYRNLAGLYQYCADKVGITTDRVEYDTGISINGDKLTDRVEYDTGISINGDNLTDRVEYDTGISINGDKLTLKVNGGFRSPSELTESQSLQYFGKIVSYLSVTNSFRVEQKEVMIEAAKVLFEKASKDYEVKDELKDIVGHIGGILRDKAGIKESGNAFENFYRNLADLYQYCADKVGITTDRVKAAGKLVGVLNKYTPAKEKYAENLKNALSASAPKSKKYNKIFVKETNSNREI